MADGERPEAAEERRNGRFCSSEPTKVSGSVGATVAGMSAKLSAILPRDLCRGECETREQTRRRARGQNGVFDCRANLVRVWPAVDTNYAA